MARAEARKAGASTRSAAEGRNACGGPEGRENLERSVREEAGRRTAGKFSSADGWKGATRA